MLAKFGFERLVCRGPVVLALLGVCATALGAAALQPLSKWNGTWVTSDGETMGIMVRDEYLNLYGSDKASNYRATCALDRSESHTVICIGDGYDYSHEVRFNYRSHLRYVQSGPNAGAIIEEWEGQVSEGSSDTNHGRSVFIKKDLPSDKR